MKRLLIFIFFFQFLSLSAHGLSYDVYDHETPYPYIMLQPSQGIFLGQMMRNIGLDPDWQNRRWIDLIHQANPDQVDEAGEILYHSTKLKVPLSALKVLIGYNKLQNHFRPYMPPVEEPAPQPEPVQEVAEPAPVEEPATTSGVRLDFTIGGGSESLSANNGIGNETELFNEANGIFKISFLGIFNDYHRFGFSAMAQLKTYEAPPSVGYTEDHLNLYEFRYHYGYKIFNNVFLDIVGQSRQFNALGFVNNTIVLETYFGHSLGLGIFAPLFYIGPKQMSFYIDGQFIYADVAETNFDPGFYASAELKIEPKGIESGWLIGARMNYYSQQPENYSEHQAYEGLGFLGYAF